MTDAVVLGELLGQGIQTLTGAASPEQAWCIALGSARRIVLKFNSVASEVISTSDAMARVLVGGLAAAGYDPAEIALVEAPKYLTAQLGTRQPERGWGTSIAVGGRQEPLANYLHAADAIINVPFLETHQIAGMSGCLKNLSHALIRHPAAYHRNGCAPYVGQVVGSKEVSSKLKLNLVNAVRIVVNKGPDAVEEDVAGYGGLLLGFDPVAVDAVGLEILSLSRRRAGLGGNVRVPYLASAAELNVGRWRPAQIERIAPRVGA